MDFIMTDQIIVGHIVMKNEAHRYLKQCLEYYSAFCNTIVAYDDRSDDESVGIAQDFGCHVQVRKKSDSSFLENEGAFRQQAWDFLGKFVPENRWIICFDADEFLVGRSSVRRVLFECIDKVDKVGAVSVSLPIGEVFGYRVDGRPMVRTDGYWGKIRGTRLVRYRSLPFKEQMGKGSVPEALQEGAYQEEDLKLLHYGYATVEDKYEKYERYHSQLNNGHSNSHIESIIREPTLKLWVGDFPKVFV